MQFKLFNIKNFLVICICFICSSILISQTPAKKQKEAIGIKNATLHIGNGKIIEKGFVGFIDGKINFIGAISDANIPTYSKIIDAENKHIYPGLIAVNTNLGLVEIDAAKQTRDFAEVGNLNPNVRSIIAYNAESKVIGTVRSNGVLLAQIVPQGGRISGSSSVVELDAWNWEDAALNIDEGIHLNWPSLSALNFSDDNDSKKRNLEYLRQKQEIDLFFSECQAYLKNPNHDTKNLKFEAMKKVFDSKANLYIHVEEAKEMMASIAFAEKYSITPVIVGGYQSFMILDFLKQHHIPVILGRPHSLPSNEDDDINQCYKNAKILKDAGILYCLSDIGFWQQRNLPFQAGESVAFGLDKESALSSVSLNTAKILKIDNQVGSLEIGKDATFVISDGDLLNYLGNKVKSAYIKGKELDLDNKQKELFRTYQTKFESSNK